MIMDFGLADREEDAGYYAGQLAGCFAVAQFFSGFIFGYLADKYSKRKVFLISCTGTALTMLCFGFSRHFGFAVFFRTLCGLFNGNVSTGKAYLADITDSTNQAYAYSFYGLTWGFGAILGPAIGGLLSRPAKTYAAFDTPFFNTYPYVLPCIFCVVTQMAALAMCQIYMTQPPKAQQVVQVADDDEELPDILEGVEYTAVTEIEYDDDDEDVNEKTAMVTNQSVAEASVNMLKDIYIDVKDAVSDRDVLITATMYFFTSCCDTMQEELFPLWSIIPSVKGGLSFTNQTIGIYNTMQGFLLLVQPTCFNYVVGKLNKLNTYRLGFLLVLPFMMTPLLNVAQTVGGDYFLWVVLFVYCFMRMFTTMCTFTAVFILINNAAPFGKVGTVLGFSNSAGCMARAVATFSAGPILSFFATSVFAMHVPFIIACGVMAAAALSLSTLLRPSINELKPEITVN
jgi:MFS family permease